VENRLEIKEALYLQIEAASTGRPNRAMEIANLEAMMPRLIELATASGLPLDPLIKYAAKVLEFDFDVEAWLAMRGSAPAMPMMNPGGGPEMMMDPAGNAPAMPAQVQRMLPG
jgi:hypothetical protein